MFIVYEGVCMSVNTSSEMDHHEEESGAGAESHGKQDDEVCVGLSHF